MKPVHTLQSTTSEHSLEEQLALLAEITQGFASSLDIEEALNTAIRQFVVYLEAEAVSIFLLENDDTELVCHACAGPVDISGLRMDASQGIVGTTVKDDEAQMVRDVSNNHAFEASVDAGTGFVTRSILCAPLTVKGQCIGALELINKRGGDGLFDLRDRHLLTALASAAALSIHNARMASALIEQQRIQKEIELAREIQEGLLPNSEDHSLPVYGMNVPARGVSGDFFDFFELPDGRIYFNIADVSGKGINAALLMAKTSSLLRCLAKQIHDPGELLKRVNNEVFETITHGMFITLVSGFVDPETGHIELSNAGHQPPLYHSSDGGFHELHADAPPIGIMPDVEFPVEHLELKGGKLYLFTDGVTEATDKTGQILYVAGLIGLIEKMSEHYPFQRLQNIVAEIRSPGEQQHDDITMMLIECNSLESETDTSEFQGQV